jgi:hypothetical protein
VPFSRLSTERAPCNAPGREVDTTPPGSAGGSGGAVHGLGLGRYVVLLSSLACHPTIFLRLRVWAVGAYTSAGGGSSGGYGALGVAGGGSRGVRASLAPPPMGGSPLSPLGASSTLRSRASIERAPMDAVSYVSFGVPPMAAVSGSLGMVQRPTFESIMSKVDAELGELPRHTPVSNLLDSFSPK